KVRWALPLPGWPQRQPTQPGPYGSVPNMSGAYDPATQMQPPPMYAGNLYPGAPQAMMPDMLRAGIPPYCATPTYQCLAFHSHHLPCAWSCPVSALQAMPGGVDPAAQLGALQQQLMAQLAAVPHQQSGIGAGGAPTTIAETDRLIQELEVTVQQLRAHRAALERLAVG